MYKADETAMRATAGWVVAIAMYAAIPGVSVHFTGPVQETALLIGVMAARRKRLRHA